MSTYCPKCGSLIPAAEINLDLNVAHCRACDHVSEGAASALSPEPKPPGGVTVAQQGDDLVIAWSWFSLTRVVYLGFGALVLAQNASKVLLFPTLFNLGWVAIGALAIYVGACGLVNKTTVRVGKGRLQVSHGPLPWAGGGTYDTASLVRLHAERHVTRSRKGGRTVTFSLEADLRDGKTITLMEGLEDEPTAEYFDKKIERTLGIVDLT